MDQETRQDDPTASSRPDGPTLPEGVLPEDVGSDRRARRRTALNDRRRQVRGKRKGKKGMTLIWAGSVLTVLLGVSALALDFGRAMLGQSQLQSAVDAAALHGVTGLDVSPEEARRRVRQALDDNAVMGRRMLVEDVEIDCGVWDPRLRSFTKLPAEEEGTATAIRVRVNVDGTTNEGLQPVFAQMLGDEAIELAVVTTVTRGEPFDLEIDSRSSPYLAGMPAGSSIPYTAGYQPPANHPLRKGVTKNKNKTYKHGEHPGKSKDVHEKFTDDDPVDPKLAKKKWTESGDECAPLQVDIRVYPGQVLYFRDVNGGTGDYASNGKEYSLDGNTNRGNIAQVPVNGFDTTTGPLNALMGVFLTDAAPDTTPYRQGMDFSTAASRNYDSLEPDTKQIFFIGDGMSNEGYGRAGLQRIVVPDGATRLFLGVQDEYGFWWDNFGSVRTTMFEGNPTIVE